MSDRSSQPLKPVEPTSVADILANRRDVLKTATGLVAAAAVGGMFLTSSSDVAAAEGESDVMAEQDATTNVVAPNRTAVKFNLFPQPFLVYAVQNGVASPYTLGTAGGGIQRGEPQFSEIVLTKQIDVWTPALQRAIAAGTTFTEVVITVYRNSTVYSRYILSDVGVTSSSVSFSGDGSLADMVESVSLAFAKIEYKTLTGRYIYDLEQGVVI